MIYVLINLYLILASVYATNSSDQVKAFSKSKSWIKLLHYEKNLIGSGYQSRINNKVKVRERSITSASSLPDFKYSQENLKLKRK